MDTLLSVGIVACARSSRLCLFGAVCACFVSYVAEHAEHEHRMRDGCLAMKRCSFFLVFGFIFVWLCSVALFRWWRNLCGFACITSFGSKSLCDDECCAVCSVARKSCNDGGEIMPPVESKKHPTAANWDLFLHTVIIN